MCAARPQIEEVFPPLIQHLAEKLGPRLVQLICASSGITTMRDLLGPKRASENEVIALRSFRWLWPEIKSYFLGVQEEEQPPVWSALRVLDCSHNQIVLMDESLVHAPQPC